METIAPLWLWITFAAIVLASLFVDFVVLKKQGAHDIGVKEALNWSLIWIALSFVFNGLLWWAVKDHTGSTALANTKSLEFLTGYLIEKSLAVDNIFVFLMIFTYFAVPKAYQKRVLMIGIIGAIVLRTVMILVGGWLLSEFHWVLYVFGAFLVLTGIKMWWAAGKEPDLEDNPVLKILRKLMPVVTLPEPPPEARLSISNEDLICQPVKASALRTTVRGALVELKRRSWAVASVALLTSTVPVTLMAASVVPLSSCRAARSPMRRVAVELGWKVSVMSER